MKIKTSIRTLLPCLLILFFSCGISAQAAVYLTAAELRSGILKIGKAIETDFNSLKVHVAPAEEPTELCALFPIMIKDSETQFKNVKGKLISETPEVKIFEATYKLYNFGV